MSLFGALLGPIAGAVGGALQGKAQNEAEKEARKLAQQYADADYASRKDIEARLQASGWDPAAINTLKSMSQSLSTTTSHGVTKERYKAYDPQMEAALRAQFMAALAQPQMASAAEKAAVLGEIAGQQQRSRTLEQNLLSRYGGSNAAASAGIGSPSTQQANASRIQALARFAGLDRELQDKAQANVGRYMQERAGRNITSDQTSTTSQSGTSSHEVPPDIQALLTLGAPRQLVPQKTGYSPWGNALQGASGAINAYNMYQAGQPTSYPYPQPTSFLDSLKYQPQAPNPFKG